MSLTNYQFPCLQILNRVEAKNGLRIALCNTNNEAVELAAVLNSHFYPKAEPTPQPNREETDRVAAEYYKSGRKLEVEYWNPGCRMWCEMDNSKPISFDYDYAWRIKPAKLVVDVYRTPDSTFPLLVIKGCQAVINQAWKFVGTIEGEVEA